MAQEPDKDFEARQQAAIRTLLESNNPELRKAIAELRKLQGTEEVMRREAIASKTPDPRGPEARAAAERTLARGKAEASAMGAAGRALTRGQQAAAQARATRGAGPVAGAGSLPSGTEEEMRNGGLVFGTQGEPAPGPVAGAGDFPSGTEEEMRLTSQALRQETEAIAAEDTEQFSQIQRPEERPMTAGQAIAQALGGFATGFATAYTGKDYLNPYLNTMAEIRKDRRQRQQAIDSIFARINQGGEPVAALYAQMLGATTPEEFEARLGSLSGEMAANLDREGIKLIAEQKAKEGTNEERLLTATSLLASLEAQAKVYGVTPPDISEMDGEQAIIAANSFRGKIDALVDAEQKTLRKQTADAAKFSDQLTKLNETPDAVVAFGSPEAFIANLQANNPDLVMSPGIANQARTAYRAAEKTVNANLASAAISTGKMPEGQYAQLDPEARELLGNAFSASFQQLSTTGTMFAEGEVPDVFKPFQDAETLDAFFAAGGQPSDIQAAMAWMNSREGRAMLSVTEAFAPGGSAMGLENTLQAKLGTEFTLTEDDVLVLNGGQNVMLKPGSNAYAATLEAYRKLYAETTSRSLREDITGEAEKLGLSPSDLVVAQAEVDNTDASEVVSSNLAAEAPQPMSMLERAFGVIEDTSAYLTEAAPKLERFRRNFNQVAINENLKDTKFSPVYFDLYPEEVPLSPEEIEERRKLEADVQGGGLTPDAKSKALQRIDELNTREANRDSKLYGSSILTAVGEIISGMGAPGVILGGGANFDGQLGQAFTGLELAARGQRQVEAAPYERIFSTAFGATEGARVQDIPALLFKKINEDALRNTSQTLAKGMFTTDKLLDGYNRALDQVPDIADLRESLQEQVPFKTRTTRPIRKDPSVEFTRTLDTKTHDIENRHIAAALLGRNVGPFFGMTDKRNASEGEALLKWNDMTDTELRQAIAITQALVAYGIQQ